jgi:hypothetical protein
MRPVRPINPIRPIRAIRRIKLRRAPSIGQLRRWLAFARQKAKDGLARPPALGKVAVAPKDEQWESDEATTIAAGDGHIDKRV